jgi:hypothetical protein
VRLLDVAKVASLQRGLHARADLSQRVMQVAPPADLAVTRFGHDHGDEDGVGLAPLTCLDRPSDRFLGGGGGGGEVKDCFGRPDNGRHLHRDGRRELCPRQPRRVMDSRARWRWYRPCLAGNADVDHGRARVGDAPHLGGRLVAEHRAVADAQDRAPQFRLAWHRPGDRVVNAAMQSLPAPGPMQRRDFVP